MFCAGQDGASALSRCLGHRRQQRVSGSELLDLAACAVGARVFAGLELLVDDRHARPRAATSTTGADAGSTNRKK